MTAKTRNSLYGALVLINATLGILAQQHVFASSPQVAQYMAYATLVCFALMKELGAQDPPKDPPADLPSIGFKQ